MKIKSILAGAALAFALPMAAHAVTVNSSGVSQGDGSIAIISLASGGHSIDFRYEDILADDDGDGVSGGYNAFVEFTALNDFYLTFNDYAPESDQVGFIGEQSGFSLLSGGVALIGSDSCGGLNQYGSSTCEFITGAGNTPPLWTFPPETYGLFAAGTYVLAFSEGDGPTSGSAEFLINAVPLPAAAWMLIAGIGGLAAVKRRKKA